MAQLDEVMARGYLDGLEEWPLGRLPVRMASGEPDAGFAARLDEVLPSARLDALPDFDEAGLHSVSGALEDLERDVSSQRRSVFDVIDRLQEELVRRYRSGEASVDSLLT